MAADRDHGEHEAVDQEDEHVGPPGELDVVGHEVQFRHLEAVPATVFRWLPDLLLDEVHERPGIALERLEVLDVVVEFGAELAVLAPVEDPDPLDLGPLRSSDHHDHVVLLAADPVLLEPQYELGIRSACQVDDHVHLACGPQLSQDHVQASVDRLLPLVRRVHVCVDHAVDFDRAEGSAGHLGVWTHQCRVLLRRALAASLQDRLFGALREVHVLVLLRGRDDHLRVVRVVHVVAVPVPEADLVHAEDVVELLVAPALDIVAVLRLSEPECRITRGGRVAIPLRWVVQVVGAVGARLVAVGVGAAALLLHVLGPLLPVLRHRGAAVPVLLVVHVRGVVEEDRRHQDRRGDHVGHRAQHLPPQDLLGPDPPHDHRGHDHEEQRHDDVDRVGLHDQPQLVPQPRMTDMPAHHRDQRDQPHHEDDHRRRDTHATPAHSYSHNLSPFLLVRFGL